GREPTFKFDSLRVTTLRETPTALLAEPKAPDEMRYAELGRYVDALARSGSDTRKLRVEQALKLSVPFACIIVALFGAPLAISTPRSGMAWGVAVCLATTFADRRMFQLSKAVGGCCAAPRACVESRARRFRARWRRHSRSAGSAPAPRNRCLPAGSGPSRN